MTMLAEIPGAKAEDGDIDVAARTEEDRGTEAVAHSASRQDGGGLDEVAARTEEESEEDARVARLVMNMIMGEAPSPEDEEYAAPIAAAFAIGCPDRGRSRLERRAAIPSDAGKRRRLMDVVVSRAFSAEPLCVSVARVAKAVAVIGFDVCTAFTATCAYNIYPELETEEFKGNGKRRGKGNAARSA